jgi:hypothetical protein
MAKMSKELFRCGAFLHANGWKYSSEAGSEYKHFYKDGCIGVDVSDKEIVFIGENGDFLHLPVNYYALLGALMDQRQIACDYTSA